MTFIASVIAKNGVAIIADSLATSSLPVLHYSKYEYYLATQKPNEEGGIPLFAASINNLFEWEPVYTEDYEEKLFRLNRYTAIAITGEAFINEKKISILIDDFITSRIADIEDFSISIETRLEQLAAFFTSQIKEHLCKYPDIRQSLFLISFYEEYTATARVFKLYVMETMAESLHDPEYEYIKLEKELEYAKVVCEGQSKLSNNILYGMGKELYERLPEIVEKILTKLEVPEEFSRTNFANEIISDPYFTKTFFSDLELLNLSDLSLQQAVDLASLLMSLEVDFQKYTRNIPTVGGVIKLAVIDKNGFRFISGNTINTPKYI
jgi:hypothetical protein